MLHYLQNVTPNVAAGGEVAYQYGPGIPGGGIAVVSFVGRYTGNNFLPHLTSYIHHHIKLIMICCFIQAQIGI